MECMIRLIREFYARVDHANDVEFLRNFGDLINVILDLILKELYDARDLRDVNEYYEIIYSDILRLRMNIIHFQQLAIESEIDNLDLD